MTLNNLSIHASCQLEDSSNNQNLEDEIIEAFPDELSKSSNLNGLFLV